MRRNNIEIRKPTERDMRMLVENMRDEDKQEIRAYFNENFDFAVKTSVKFSRDSWAVIVNGKLLFIAGVGLISMLGNVGCPWLLGTVFIKQFPKEFFKQALNIVEELKENYTILSNHVHADNAQAIRFLKHLGFKILDAEPYGANGQLFHPFEMMGA